MGKKTCEKTYYNNLSCVLSLLEIWARPGNDSLQPAKTKLEHVSRIGKGDNTSNLLVTRIA